MNNTSPVEIISSNIQPKPKWISSLLSDLLGFMFYPSRLAMGFFALSPLALAGLISIPISLRRIYFSMVEKRVFVLCYVISAAVLLVYIRSWHGFNVSTGIGPDIRNLMPLYLIMGIPFLILMEKIGILQKIAIFSLSWKVRTSGLLLCLVLGIILVNIGPALEEYILLFTLLSLLSGVALAGLVFAVGIYPVSPIKTDFIALMFLFLLFIPLITQVFLIIIGAATGFSGFPFWIPIMEWMYQQIFQVF